jgi:hypothetical protein
MEAILLDPKPRKLFERKWVIARGEICQYNNEVPATQTYDIQFSNGENSISRAGPGGIWMKL